MLIYYLLLIYIVFLYSVFLNKKVLYNKKYFLFCAFFAIALIVGLRGVSTGEDTHHYLEVFDLVSKASWKTVLTSIGGFQISIWGERVEYLFALLNKIISIFTNDGQIMLLIVSLLTMHLFARFIYRNISDHVFMSTFVFLCNGLFMASFNGIREMLAIAIIINAYDYIKNKHYRTATIIAIIAFFVHMSSIVMIPFFVVFTKVKNYKKGIRYMTLICMLLLVAIPVIPQLVIYLFPKYSAYITEHFWDNSYRGVVVVWVLEIALVVYMYVHKIKNDMEFLGIIGVIMYITLAIISIKLWAFSRLMTYFEPFAMIVFGCGAERFNSSSKKVYYVVIAAIMLLEYVSYAMVPTRSYSFFWI